jgi:hypothetical protein
VSKETELLRRALDDLELQVGRAIDEIRTYLAAEPEAEPVAWMREDGEIGNYNPSDYGYGTKVFPLYLHPPKPEPARKPMTEDADDEAFNSASKYAAWLETENRMLRESRKPITKREMLTWYDELRPKSVADFVLGVRCAEKHHGIGGDDVRETPGD